MGRQNSQELQGRVDAIRTSREVGSLLVTLATAITQKRTGGLLFFGTWVEIEFRKNGQNIDAVLVVDPSESDAYSREFCLKGGFSKQHVVWFDVGDDILVTGSRVGYIRRILDFLKVDFRNELVSCDVG